MPTAWLETRQQETKTGLDRERSIAGLVRMSIIARCLGEPLAARDVLNREAFALDSTSVTPRNEAARGFAEEALGEGYLAVARLALGEQRMVDTEGEAERAAASDLVERLSKAEAEFPDTAWQPTAGPVPAPVSGSQAYRNMAGPGAVLYLATS